MNDPRKLAFEYPALYQSTNLAAIESQKTLFRILIAEYSLLILAATASIGYFESKEIYYFYAIMFFCLIVILVFKETSKPEQRWYKARALAESVKTMSWRYCMKAHPFQTDDARRNNDEFRRFLRDILSVSRQAGGHVLPDFSSDDQITASMRSFRLESLKNRKDVYLVDRVREQRVWYTTKAEFNKRWAGRWLRVCAAMYGLALIMVMGRIYLPTWKLWPFEPLIVAATSLIGWIQIKRYKELSISYSLTAQEIGIIESKSQEVRAESDFSEFVNDAELAFSREHTQWTARQEDR